MTIPEWLWYVLIALAVAAFLLLVRRWSYNIAVAVELDGKDYTYHRDGHFTDSQGMRVIDPDLIAQLVPLGEAARKERFRRMDAQDR